MGVYRGKLIDLDVHHTWTSANEIIERLPQRWRAIASTARGHGLSIDGPSNSSGPPGGGFRGDSEPEVGPPGSSYPLMREQLLDSHNVDRVILGFNTGRNNGLSNPYFGQAVVRAINDWNLDTWMSIDDDRLTSVVLIPGQFIDDAVREIERLAEHPKIVAGLIGWNAFGKPLGSPVYHPIYRALHDRELMLNVHIGAGEYSNKGGAAMVASGSPAIYYDFHVLFPAEHDASPREPARARGVRQVPEPQSHLHRGWGGVAPVAGLESRRQLQGSARGNAVVGSETQ